jgi:bifunctional non-homologous end joining protein LigD
MLLQRTDVLPSGDRWPYELKLDGYRAIAFRRNGAVHLRSRNDCDFNPRYPAVVAVLAGLPDDTVIDRETVALDADGRPSFNTLQNAASSAAAIVYCVFDLMVLAGQDLRREPLDTRRRLLETQVLPGLPEPVRYSAPSWPSCRYSSDR